MTLFPEGLFNVLVLGAVAGSAVGSVALVALLVRDWSRGGLW